MRIQWVNIYFKICLIVSITTVPSAIALSDESLLNLLEKVQRNKTSEASWNSDRERRFRSEAAAQKEMMRKAEAQVSEQENLRDRLKSQFGSYASFNQSDVPILSGAGVMCTIVKKSC